MAKGKNHTNQNQNRKAHRNGIYKPRQWQMLPTRGMPAAALQALKDEHKREHPVGKKTLMSFEERYAKEMENPIINRRRTIKKIGIRKMALNGIYLN
ncbi:large subunit ribosomal protein L29e [Nematocida minor]|uniref:large subunit ribosomal protein L29e n=1 Tax=Nematocida minor TaxID=1912983 RepID=UPI00221FD3B0|nr:large subunit ribosomal protein L29e [Nematocida minor]KAI5190197.1 large subunit ribosomal protein L29e [Nematocida minor]